MSSSVKELKARAMIDECVELSDAKTRAEANWTRGR
jgi:hypothetical protein